jgi:hypothetical protein
MLKAHPLKPKIKKPKLLRSNPLRKSLILAGDDPGSILIDDEDIYVGYRKPEIVDKLKVVDVDDDLNDHVRFRLWLARQLAMKKYYETWT